MRPEQTSTFPTTNFSMSMMHGLLQFQLLIALHSTVDVLDEK